MGKVRSESICMKFLSGGVEAVKKLLDEAGKDPARGTIRNALKMLRDDDVDFSELDGFFRQRYGFGLNNHHSRSPPKVGDKKPYTITTPKAGPPYVKVPVSVFSPKKGGQVDVVFESGDRIVIERT